MPFPLDPRPHDRAALAFEDLASAMEAGLSPTQLGAKHGSDGAAALTELLLARGVSPSADEAAILSAAWDAGRAGDGLRQRAASRRSRAELLRALLAGLRYPALLLVLAVPVAFLAGAANSDSRLPLLALALIGAAIAFGVWLRIALHKGSDLLLRTPLLGSLVRDLAELPYLEVLHGLYASGVPLLQAHPRAVAACRLPALHASLLRADAALQQRQPLAAALAQAGALHAETLNIVTTGERTGDLEGALSRAMRRRSQVAGLTAQRLGRTVATVAYVIALLLVVAMIFNFYSGYFGRLRSLR